MDNIEHYKLNGFYLFRSFFDKGDVNQIKEDAKKVFINQMLKHNLISSPHITEQEFEGAMTQYFKKDFNGFINSGKTCQHLISLHRLSLSDKIVMKLKEFGIKNPNICTRPVLYFNSKNLAKSEVYYKTPPHQDWRSMQGSLNAMVVWVPLVNVDIKLGALEVIPKSHLRGLLESEKDDWFRKVSLPSKDFISVEVEQGDALFFSAFLVHQSGDNITDSIRWSCHFRYNDLDEQTFIDRSYPNPYTYAPQQELITENFPDNEVINNVFLNN